MKKMIVIESFAKFASILVMFVVALGCGSCNNIRSNFSSKEATRVEEIVRAYEAVWHAFYDEENLSKMLVVEEVPDDSVGGVRFCFYFDQLAHRLYEGIRLSLNETAYAEWKDKSEKLLDSVGASVYVVDSLDERCRIVCGKAYRFPLEIETRLSEFDRNIDENWLERFVVKVTFLDKEGAAVSSVAVPDFKFYMRSQGRFSLPFSHLSKTRDEISLSRGCVNDSCEMAFANIVFEGVNFDRDMFAYVGYEFVIKKGYNPRDFVTLGANAGSVVSNMLSNMITVRNTGLRASKYEVTQEEWFALMGFNPSKNVSPKKPAENVDYFDCLLFIDVLNSFPETHSSGMRFMLPSYDEWIFACYGDADWQSRMGATVQEFESKGWLISNSGSSTHEVGLKEPNEVGLYDMIGNVREFTRDTTDLYYKSVCGGSFKTDGYWSLTTLDMASYEQSEDCGLRLFAEPKRDLGCGCQSAGARVGDY